MKPSKSKKEKKIKAYAVINKNGRIILDRPSWPYLRIAKLKRSLDLSWHTDKVIPITITYHV